MPDLPNHLKKDLAFIIQQTGSATASVFGAAFDTELALQTDLAAAEIALRCLVAADSLERIGDSSSLLMRSEIARRLKELAFLCLDVLETDEKREIRSLLRAAREKADSIADLTGIPKSIPAVEAGLLPLRALQHPPNSRSARTRKGKTAPKGSGRRSAPCGSFWRRWYSNGTI